MDQVSGSLPDFGALNSGDLGLQPTQPPINPPMLLFLPTVLMSIKFLYYQSCDLTYLRHVLVSCVLSATTPPLLTVQPPITMAFNVRSALYLTCAASGYPPPT